MDRVKLVEGPVDTTWFSGKETSQQGDGRSGPHGGPSQVTVREEMGLR